MNPPPVPAQLPPPPIPNSYWVWPGRLLAGEYPGEPAYSATAERIQRLLAAGVTTFIDLTAEGELAPYLPLLPDDGSVVHQRWPIPDHDLPESPGYMQQILDAIDASLAQERCIYVHCRAGIGRTGTTVGCHLTRRGFDSYQALERLNQLWRQSARSQRWPTVPETDEQYRYVQEWYESARSVASADLSPDARREGALIGLVCAEAFVTHGIGANAATTLAALSSLRERRAHDAQDQMQRYLAWSRTAPAATVAPELRRALAAWQWSKKPNAGSHDPKNLTAHTLARSLAAVLFESDAGRALDLAADLCRTTSQSPVVIDVCRLWAALLFDALAGADKRALMSLQGTPAIALLRGQRLRKEVSALLDEGWRQAITGEADVVSICASALHAFEQSAGFAEGLQLVVAKGTDAGTRAALYGSIAGACLGVNSIPPRWIESVPQLATLQTLARTGS